MIITEHILRETLLIDEPNTDSYILYGSYARGDHDEFSDIDILRITTSRMRSQRVNGRIFVHVYDVKDLLELARSGSLFILHLIREAKPLVDPCEYLRDISAAFKKPDCYAIAAREMTSNASRLLDVDDSLFEIAPKPFMDAAIFLCRTLIYAEHADRGPFSFSLRVLAEHDEIALMISNIKERSVSYEDFRRIRHAVREKLRKTDLPSEALTMDELAGRSQGDALFEGLFRRIAEIPERIGYLSTSEVSSTASTDRCIAARP